MHHVENVTASTTLLQSLLRTNDGFSAFRYAAVKPINFIVVVVVVTRATYGRGPSRTDETHGTHYENNAGHERCTPD